jgi:hypothetical protein
LTSVASLGVVPSFGIFCTKPEMIGAALHAGSSSAPSMCGAAVVMRAARATLVEGACVADTRGSANENSVARAT